MKTTSALALALAPLLPAPPAIAATFTVTTTDDSESPIDGYLSLREAINAANANAGVQDTIEFNLAGAGPHVISVGSGTAAGMPLPTIIDSVIINGPTDGAGVPLVVLDGANANQGGEQNGLYFFTGSDASEVRGLWVQNFPGRGINVYTHGNLIENNVVTLNGFGILLSNVNFNQILNNVVTNNQNHGIWCNGDQFADGKVNTIKGNRVVGNGGNGLHLWNYKSFVEDNVFSGNAGNGVEVFFGSTDNSVEGNWIGTDETGAQLGNGQNGVLVWGESSLNQIGGFDFDPRSGLNKKANTIAHNGGDGVRVATGTMNSIRGNSIFSNGGLGIDLGGDGVTPNDLHPIRGPQKIHADIDLGANDLQNFPTIVNVHTAGDITTVIMNLATEKAADVAIDLYISDDPDASGFGEGQKTLRHSLTVTTPPYGATLVIKATVRAVPGGSVITATATRDRNTSEFSNAFPTPRRVVRPTRP